MSIGIYKITSPSGKIYIGQSINIEVRWKKYKDSINHNQRKIYRSIKKYGYESHVFEIIEECNIEELDYKEFIYKQELINTIGWKNVLFCNLKDGKGGKRSKATRDKISKSNKGKKYSIETKLKMSESRKKRIISKETGDKISKSKKGIRINSIFTEERNSKLRKPIYQFDKDGVFIAKYESYIIARQITKIKMTEAVRGKAKTAGGYIWKKEEDLNNINYDHLLNKLKI